MPGSNGTSGFVTLPRWPVCVVAAAALAALACDALLGLDAPSLAPCAGGCLDAAADEGTGVDAGIPPEAGAGIDAAADVTADSHASSSDAASDGALEAQSDAAPPLGSIRCGGGAYPTSYCIGATPLCCQGGTGLAATFTCVASAAACNGYAIECANYNDCAGTEICCRFMQHQVCDVPANCPPGEIVCQTNMSDSCPTGYKCDVPFVGDAAASSAYLGCSQ
jgi:hypothetical protein